MLCLEFHDHSDKEGNQKGKVEKLALPTKAKAIP